MTVFVLGAGASLHAGYPLAGKLGEDLHNWACLNRQTAVAQLFGFLDSLRELYGSLSDFERVLTELIECPAGSRAESLTQMQRGNTRGAIEVLVPEFFWSRSQGNTSPSLYDDLARNLMRDGDIILTFNYDLACERALRKASLWEIGDGYGFDVASGQLPRSKVKMLKLHGSINWLGLIFGGIAGGSSASSVYGPRPCVFGDRYFSYLGYPPEFRDPLARGITNTGGEPSVILPALHKIFFNETFAGRELEPFWDALWGLAGEALHATDKIVIIGYSMPQADERARELLMKGSNPDAEILVFSGGSTPDICQAFRKKGFRKVTSSGSCKFEDYLAK